MPAITFSSFNGGLDRRLRINVQESNRLWVLRNAEVTTGKKLKKRPGLRKVATGLAGTYGLFAENSFGAISVFNDVGSTTLPPSAATYCKSVPITSSGTAGWSLSGVHYATLFQGRTFLTAKYALTAPATPGTRYQHHYLDAFIGGTAVTTAPASVQNLPYPAPITKTASRIFIGQSSPPLVHFCAVGAARDWTTANDAGNLDVGAQQDVSSDCTALGVFQNSLVVFFVNAAQVWAVAADPAFIEIQKKLSGVGAQSAYCAAGFSNDLMFLSPLGFRTMNVSAVTDRVDDMDVGSPIDSLVRPDISGTYFQGDRFQSFWLPARGQFWCLFNMGSYSKAWVYSYSRFSKLSCWSEYVFPMVLTNMVQRGTEVFARSADNLYQLVDDQYTDDGVLIDVEIQMAFQDAKTPGVQKQFYGADFVIEGTAQVAYKYDPRDLDKETDPQTITGDTRPGDMIPVEIVSPCLAPVFRQSADAPLEIDALTLYFNALGTM